MRLKLILLSTVLVTGFHSSSVFSQPLKHTKTKNVATKSLAAKTVVLDEYYNHELKKDVDGKMVPYHYIWNDSANSGFSILGGIFREHGAMPMVLTQAPNENNLQQASIYIIVDPDTKAETADPHYMTADRAEIIFNWVKAGGVLVVFENDSANAEIQQFNMLTEKFGIHFNENSRNKVIGKQFEMGALQLPAGHPIFPSGPKVYLKEISTIKVTAPAKSVFTDKGDVIMAVSKVGKGTVFAVGDPWLYNEYVDGKKLTPDFKNKEAADELVTWLLAQSKK